MSSHISALDDQGWDVKQQLLTEWLKEEGSERTWPIAFHGKTWLIENDKNGERKHLTVSVVAASVEEFERDHSTENVGRFVLTTNVNDSDDDNNIICDRHCVYASEWDDWKIICPTNDPGPTRERGIV